MTMADHMVADGYRDVGYEYVSIDDCWTDHNRTADGELQPDPKRFPSGIPALAQYLHGKGLKLGIYADYGTKTCAGYPGSIDHIQQDMNTFAKWGVDYLKLDGCYSDPKTYDTGYPKVTAALNVTGRPIVFSCSWPAYQVGAGIKPNYARIAEFCNLWRNYDDIQDSWGSVLSIINYYGDSQDDLVPVAGPGHWNDPDQLIIGDSLTVDQAKAQMAIWSIMASPLIMSNDLRTIKPEFKAILQNKEIIAVNQDKLGKMGSRRFMNNAIQVWSRPLADGSVAVAVINVASSAHTVPVSFEEIGLRASTASVRDLFAFQNLGDFTNGFTTAAIRPTGALMFKVTASKQ
ncbi:alpha-N-acetylgalactosaminidase isoform X2 [Nematostella vectensis]|nr:alpha-N-acetylgalactosaminidase isoform X2 [Nematostella vectensis]